MHGRAHAAALPTTACMRHTNALAGACDGYARILRSPALALLHLGPGLGNGLCNLHNARRAGSPVLMLVGDMATWHRAAGAHAGTWHCTNIHAHSPHAACRHASMHPHACTAADPPLSQDIEALAATVSGRVLTVTSPAGAAATMREALAATQPPAWRTACGSGAAARPSAGCAGSRVVTVLLPHDISWAPAEPEQGQSTALLMVADVAAQPPSLADSHAAAAFIRDCAAALRAAPRGKAALYLGGQALLAEGRQWQLTHAGTHRAHGAVTPPASCMALARRRRAGMRRPHRCRTGRHAAVRAAACAHLARCWAAARSATAVLPSRGCSRVAQVRGAAAAGRQAAGGQLWLQVSVPAPHSTAAHSSALQSGNECVNMHACSIATRADCLLACRDGPSALVQLPDDRVWELDASWCVAEALQLLEAEIPGAAPVRAGVNCGGVFAPPQPARPPLPTGALTPQALCQVVAALQPADCIIVDESLTSGTAYWEASKARVACSAHVPCMHSGCQWHLHTRQ